MIARAAIVCVLAATTACKAPLLKRSTASRPSAASASTAEAAPSTTPADEVALAHDGAALAANLRSALEARLASFRGVAGVYVRRAADGVEVALRADETFPTASLVKIPILVGVFARIDAGEIGYREVLVYDEKRKYPGADLLASFKSGETISLHHLVMLMTAFSDNTASLWCQEIAGGGTAINRWLDTNGYSATRVNSITEGRQEHKKVFGWGQTTPREMGRLLESIGAGGVVSPAASEEMHRLLSRSAWSQEALSTLPPEVAVASKQGAVNASRSEVLLVHAPRGDYVVCVITREQKDESWEHANEGFVLLRDVSRIVWEHFEPDWAWTPAAGAERYR